MTTILRISDAASLGMHAAILIAAAGEERLSASKMADEMDVSEAHLAKVLQRLARAGLVRSARGPGGGFVLGRPADAIRLMDVYEAVEGSFGSESCLLGRLECPGRPCVLGKLVSRVNREVRECLTTTRVSDVVNERMKVRARK